FNFSRSFLLYSISNIHRRWKGFQSHFPRKHRLLPPFRCPKQDLGHRSLKPEQTVACVRLCVSMSDFRGCVLTPEVTMILHEAGSWQESIRSCEDQNLSLISLPSEALQKQTCRNLRGNDAKQVWIGTRRSSLTGDWYWLNRNGFNDTNWARSEPGDVSEGQCAVMSLEGDCGWKDRNCCEDARPLCYADPQLLQII
uniref:C-type lectin domain-containing protein n=1 Tax=Poecilia reticulata TaxID=8081 RepID=A0A3P9PHF1_POERE